METLSLDVWDLIVANLNTRDVIHIAGTCRSIRTLMRQVIFTGGITEPKYNAAKILDLRDAWPNLRYKLIMSDEYDTIFDRFLRFILPGLTGNFIMNGKNDEQFFSRIGNLYCLDIDGFHGNLRQEHLRFFADVYMIILRNCDHITDLTTLDKVHAVEVMPYNMIYGQNDYSLLGKMNFNIPPDNRFDYSRLGRINGY